MILMSFIQLAKLLTKRYSDYRCGIVWNGSFRWENMKSKKQTKKNPPPNASLFADTFPCKHEMDFWEADLDDDKTFLTRHLDI